ncbi:50S ribosomal protein L32 [Candidatus Uhrbacteria bacterium]|nr:50S ribosomal protein L32 [Candidatus Uhrbacteria bacterium]
MGLPGHRRTSSDKRRRASHFALKTRNLAACAHCKKPVLPHHACKFCGWYAGRQVVAVRKTKSEKMKERKTAKK